MKLSSTELIEEALKTQNVKFSRQGALVSKTGKFTGRAPENRFIARYAEIESDISWGPNNQPIDVSLADAFISKTKAYVEKQRHYDFEGFLGAYPLALHSVSAWHTHFGANMFRSTQFHGAFSSDETIKIYHAPFITTEDLGMNIPQKTLVVLDFVKKRIAIVGTEYAGEIKKAAFTMANFLLPASHVLPMHASANCLPDGSNSCVLFGLSGTGKTTLSADPSRALIGDDEIIWSDNGIANLEGGCYAKLIDLGPDTEPEIYSAVNRFGAIQENVVMDCGSRVVDYTDSSITENTRGSYPLEFLSNVYNTGSLADAPKTIVFLTADAFGALPAVARLDPSQAMYHFVSGYTAKVAGTELGVKEPKAVFSTCFGAPFMPRPSMVYAKMLAERAEKAGATFWLLNTGWNGGYAKGKRFPLQVSRTLLSEIQSGGLARCRTTKHPVFGFEVPKTCHSLEDKWLFSHEGKQVQELQTKFEANPELIASGLSL